jgi:aromatic ring hydroxylase
MINDTTYRASRKIRAPNLHKWGKAIKDVTCHSATRLNVAAIGACCNGAFDQDLARS